MKRPPEIDAATLGRGYEGLTSHCPGAVQGKARLSEAAVASP